MKLLITRINGDFEGSDDESYLQPAFQSGLFKEGLKREFHKLRREGISHQASDRMGSVLASLPNRADDERMWFRAKHNNTLINQKRKKQKGKMKGKTP